MTTFKFNITDDFIGVFDGAFPEELLDKFIHYYNELEQNGLVKARSEYVKKPSAHIVDDSAFDLLTGPWHQGLPIHYINHEFVTCFWGFCYPEYCKKYSILNDFPEHKIYDMKIQKTKPGQGYHIWHSEATNRENCNRLFAFMLNLNDVDEGGETEFLYLKKRIKPQRNRLLIWPAGFTHTHRGNQPLSGEKYIITGWIEL